MSLSSASTVTGASVCSLVTRFCSVLLTITLVQCNVNDQKRATKTKTGCLPPESMTGMKVNIPCTVIR